MAAELKVFSVFLFCVLFASIWFSAIRKSVKYEGVPLVRITKYELDVSYCQVLRARNETWYEGTGDYVRRCQVVNYLPFRLRPLYQCSSPLTKWTMCVPMGTTFAFPDTPNMTMAIWKDSASYFLTMRIGQSIVNRRQLPCGMYEGNELQIEDQCAPKTYYVRS